MTVVAVLVAGAVGALLRYAVNRAVRAPWGVLVVNAAGSAIGGVVLALASGDVRLILLTGFCGGLTTFSTWTVETVQLVQDDRWRIAALSVAANLAIGIGFATAGYLLAR